MTGLSSTLIIIPAFNEQDALPSTLQGLLRFAEPTGVLVVDDGSTDQTAAVAASAGTLVARLPFNLGIGGALRTGFRYAHQHGYAAAVQFDADGQHNPADIAPLLAPLLDGADMVIGSRFLVGSGQYHQSAARGWAMGALRRLVHRQTGQTFSDTSSGLRAFGPRALALFARQYPVEYLDSVEALMLAIQHGLRVVEVPATMHERQAGVASNRRFKLAYHYLRLLVVMGTSGPGSPA
jgi:glycosyltransferase involved in cell wall biosynthesis